MKFIQEKTASLAGLLLFIAILLAGCEISDKGSSGDQKVNDVLQALKIKPYRVLIVIDDQWKDPMSYHIDPTRVEGTEFLDVVTMLKIWGVPFDILRLDEQRLQINRFLNGMAEANYGCIIWMANPDKLDGYSAYYPALDRAIYEYGISLITLFDNIKNEDIAGIAGVDYAGTIEVMPDSPTNKLTISGNHFITEGMDVVKLPERELSAGISMPAANGITPVASRSGEDTAPFNVVECTAGDSVAVLGTVGSIPQFVVRDVDQDTKVIWIGGGRDWFRKYPVMRTIFRRALVYAIGYGVFNDNFENGFIFIMDDVGCSEHAWSLRWHYPTPKKDTLIKYLIEPLEKYGFMMVQMITPGYANPETKMIESPWSVEPFKDIFGNWQDYPSTKEGLDEGLRRNVFEIQPHRAWSHMNWDLDSPPGPWWGSPVDGELAVTDWYNEVVDVRRGHVPVPSNDLLFLYRTGIDAIIRSFGVVPLAAEVRPGASVKSGYSGGYDNGRVAAIAGLGISRECYVGFDYTIEFSMMMPEQFTCHDLDLTAQTDHPADRMETEWDSLLSMTTEELLSSKIAGGRRINLRDNLDWIESRKDKHWMGFNEACAYLHAKISGSSKSGITINYDDHYCRHFTENNSFWTLELADHFLKNLQENSSLVIDGNIVDTPLQQNLLLKIPPGIGMHKISILNRK